MPLPHRRILRVRSLAMGRECSQRTLMRANRGRVHLSLASHVSASPGSKTASKRIKASQARRKHIKPDSRRALSNRRRPITLLPPSIPPRTLAITLASTLASTPQTTPRPPRGCHCRPMCGLRLGRPGWSRPGPGRCCGHTGTLARTCATRKPPAGLNAASFCSVCCKTWGILRARTPSGPRVCRQTRQHCPPLHHSRKVPMRQTPMFSGLGPCSSRPEE